MNLVRFIKYAIITGITNKEEKIMTKVFTEIIKLSDSSVKGFEVAEKNASSSARKKQDTARKERRDRLNKLRASA